MLLVRAPSLAVVVLATVTGSPPVRSDQPSPTDPVRAWNGLALDAVRGLTATRARGAVDAYGARLYAMVNVAMYDAVNGILSRRGQNDRRDQALVPSAEAPPEGDVYAAASAAAHAVLVGEIPERAATYDAQLASDLVGGGAGNGAAGQAWGAQVGALVRAARANDGSSPTESQPGSSEPGKFRASWSGVQFRNLAPFGIAPPTAENPHPYAGSGPPALTSLDYAAAFAEEKLVGSAAIADNAKLNDFRFWSLGGGTSQPPGAWIQVALVVTAEHPLPLPETTRLFALLTMAMADTVAPTFYTKWYFRHWRPATAIREADTDGNALTDADPSWNPRSSPTGANIGTSPEYWSGHSSFSGAGAAALAGFFCNDGISFSLLTDSASAAGLPPRPYTGFSAAAAEAGRSRVVGGIHFEFSNQQALASGRAVAAEILGRRLLLQNGTTHFGQCPL